MSLQRSRRLRATLSFFALAAALCFAGCANMPLNKPSALSPAHHGTAEAP